MTARRIIIARSLSAFVSMILFLLLLDGPSSLKAQNLTEGSVCTVGDRTGICKPLWDCPTPYQNIYPSSNTCRFVSRKPIICCLSLTDTTTKPTTVVRSSIISGDVGSKARAKCEEYSSYVYQAELLPLLMSKPVFINKSQCAIDGKLMPNSKMHSRQKRITGGIQAKPKEFPHVAAVGYGDSLKNVSWLCGGTLISEKFVLTVAHCASSIVGQPTWVRVGVLNLVQSTSIQDLRIIQIIIYPKYKPPSKYDDIALLKLQENVIFNAWVRPSCLPYSYPDIGSSNTKAIVTGWGKVDFAEEVSNTLLKVMVNFIPNQQCNSEYTGENGNRNLKFGIIEDRQICAGILGRDTCQGDSGGPLVVLNNDHYCMYNLIGITSFGKACGIAPSVYTRVYYYLSWIEDIVWPNL